VDRRAFLLALTLGTAAAVTGCEQMVTGHRASGFPRTDPESAPATPYAGSTVRRAGTSARLPASDGSRLASEDPTDVVPGPSSASAGAPSPDPDGVPSYPGTPSSSPGGAPPTGSAAGSARTLDRLPGGGRKLALTVDDGTSSEVLDAYLDFAKDTGTRITFFVNGVRPSWTEHAAKLRPMIESGQLQVANHTWDHPDITRLSASALADQLNRNERFLNNTFGVTGRPFFRPPYGYHNRRTDEVCAQLGYTDVTLWYGSLGDSAVLSPAQVLANATQWFRAQRIVIGHANHPAVTAVYPDLIELIRERNLTTVTLREAFYPDPAQPAGASGGPHA
jgi:peptidoglycan/xylan/chitin deacetylase (PgdA/CDA1 family)